MKYAFYLEVERNLAGALPIAHHDEYIIAQHRVCSSRQILFELGLLIHTTTVIRASGPCRVWREIRAWRHCPGHARVRAHLQPPSSRGREPKDRITWTLRLTTASAAPVSLVVIGASLPSAMILCTQGRQNGNLPSVRTIQEKKNFYRRTPSNLACYNEGSEGFF